MGNFFAHAIAHKAHREGILDIRKGIHLFRSREVAAGTKMGALSIGAIFTLLLMGIEVPLETVVGFLLPFVGPAIDLAVDGAEVILLPLLVGAAVLPHLVRKAERQIVTIE